MCNIFILNFVIVFDIFLKCFNIIYINRFLIVLNLKETLINYITYNIVYCYKNLLSYHYIII